MTAADVNGDALDDFVVGAGPGGGPQVRTFSGDDLSRLDSFFAYDDSFHGGLFVAGAPHGADAPAGPPGGSAELATVHAAAISDLELEGPLGRQRGRRSLDALFAQW